MAARAEGTLTGTRLRMQAVWGEYIRRRHTGDDVFLVIPPSYRTGAEM